MPNENETYKIIAMADAINTGVKKSEIVNLENTMSSVKTVINSLNSKSKMQIQSVNVIYSGGDLKTEIISGMHSINSRDPIIEEHHIETAKKNAISKELPCGRVLVEDILLDYILDESNNVANPIGMSANSLQVNFMRIHVDKNRLDTITNMLKDISLDYENIFSTSLCSALGATTPQQRENGVLVINFGGGSTNWAIYADKKVRSIGGFPVGGDHITNDIRCAFNTNNENAEILKKKQGSATIITSKHRLQYKQDFTDKYLALSDLSRVVNARVDEMVRIIYNQIEAEGLLPVINSIIICGKGATLNNLTTLISNIFLQLPCSIANPSIPYKEIKEGAQTTGYVPLIGAAICCTKEAILEESRNKSKNLWSKLFS